MELTKKDTKMLQGLSVLAMVCLHLFDRYDHEGLFQPCVYLWGYPLSLYFGQLSDFCVMGFAFCSGYSHLFMYDTMPSEQYRQRSWKRIANLYCNYWIILNLFTLVSILMGQADRIPGSIGSYLGHFLGLLHTYNESWWYLFAYVVLVAASPQILRWVKNHHSIPVLLASMLIYVAAFLVRYKSGWNNWFAVQFGKLGMTFFEYVVGVVFFKEKLFTQLHGIDSIIRQKIGKACYTIGWFLVFMLLLIERTIVVPNMIAAPFSGLVIIIGFSLMNKPLWFENLFLLLGKHSTNIWLTHLFFYAVIFVDFIYIAKYPVLILLFMMLITISLSCIIHKVMKPIQKHLSKAE